jgi:lysophospholipase L1-like esterase
MRISTFMKTPRKHDLALLLLGIAFALLIGEVAVRILVGLDVMPFPHVTDEQFVHRYSENFDLVYEMKPNSDGFDGNAAVRTNSMGNKDFEYSLEKPGGVYRIAIIGDSVAFGQGVILEDIFAKRLERKLNEIASEYQVDRLEILNFSVTGYNSWQEEIVLREKVLRTSPDVVMIAYCMNDDTHTDGLYPLTRQMHPSAVGSKLHSMLISLAMNQLEKLTYGYFINLGGAAHLFDSAKAVKEIQNVKPVVVIFPYRFTDPAGYAQIGKHQAVRALAESRSIPVLDFMDYTKQLSVDDRVRLYRDPVHFSSAGMKAIADWLFDHREVFMNRAGEIKPLTAIGTQYRASRTH